MTTMKRLRRSLNPYRGEADRSYLDTKMTESEWNLSSNVPPNNNENCTMPCHNGGSCRLGKPLHGFSSELLEDEDKLHYSAYSTTMHCMCPTGWMGLHCEIKLRVCPSSQACFHQGPCHVSEDDYGMPFRHCECDAHQTDFTLPYVAHFCGQAATTICKSTGFLCKNGGKCLESQPGCECTEGWEGPQCAHVEGTYPKQTVEKKDKVAFSLFAFAVAACIMALVTFYNRKRRRLQQKHVTNKKCKGHLDYDAFLDEYESSNDVDSLRNMSKSFSDFDSSGEDESYDDEDSDISSGGEGSDEESFELTNRETSSPLYSDPDVL